MAIYSYFIVFYCFLFFSTRVFLAESSGEVVSLSPDQINLFLENMDTFLSSKCKFSKNQFLFGKFEFEKKLKKCLFELNVAKIREIFKLSEGKGTNSMEIDQQQSPSTMTANVFMEMILTKMVAQLPHIPILLQSEQNVLLDQQLSNLTPEQNLSIVLELFDVANNVGNIFLSKLKKDERRKMTDHFNSFRLINLEYYKEMMRKFEFAVKFKRSANWFDITEHFDVTISSHKSENIFGLKLAVNIDTLILMKIIEIIGNFINKSCGKNMWNSVDHKEELKNCSNHINFAELGTIFESEHVKRDERDDNSFILANLIVGILKNEALVNEADKRLFPYNMDIFAQIDDAEMKLSVLKGLLECGRLFMETFGIFAMEMRVLGDWRTMLWKNIPITFTSYDRAQDEVGAIKNALEKAGLIEAMGDEIVRNRDSLLAKAGVKRKNISRMN